MAVIKFTEADRKTSQLAQTGWYRLRVKEIEGPKASTSGKSVTFFATFQIVGGDLAQKEFTIAYNTGTKQSSVLGTTQYMPHVELISLAAAALDMDRMVVPADFDTDSIVGKEVDGKIEKGIHEGIPLNTVVGFLPAGKGKDAAPAF